MAEVITIDPDAPAPEPISKAVRVIQEKGVIIYPTETLYGLGANPLFPEAMQRIYAIKGRAAAKPIPFLIKDQEMLATLVEEVPAMGRKLMARFWPGALTLIFRAKQGLKPPLMGQDGSIGLRISASPIAKAIAEAMDAPLTATSANLAGREDLFDARQLAQLFGNQVDLILDAGKVAGIGSTVVDVTVEPARVVREGMIKNLLREL
jgi:L-threonylcarbamoyladenylate synthase